MTDEPNDTPPPMNDDEPSQDPVESVVDSVADAIPTATPGDVALGQGKLGEKDEKTMGMLAHMLGAVTGFLGPLIIWLIKKDESPFVDDQGKESLNFQITIAIGFVALYALQIVLAIAHLGAIGGIISCGALPLLWVANLVLSIMGGLAANKGIAHRYPFALRLIS